jgi:hypothetical protein
VVQNPDPRISIFNCHYALPEAATKNLQLGRVMALDETGFMPHNDFHYRREAWQFMLAGGGIYNNLDYSFTVGEENGTHPIKGSTPGWGGKTYRTQLRFMKDFLCGFPFYHMEPIRYIVEKPSGDQIIQAFGETGKQYAIYVCMKPGSSVRIEIPDGKYNMECYSPETTRLLKKESIRVSYGSFPLALPAGVAEAVYKIVKAD